MKRESATTIWFWQKKNYISWFGKFRNSKADRGVRKLYSGKKRRLQVYSNQRLLTWGSYRQFVNQKLDILCDLVGMNIWFSPFATKSKVGTKIREAFSLIKFNFFRVYSLISLDRLLEILIWFPTCLSCRQQAGFLGWLLEMMGWIPRCLLQIVGQSSAFIYGLDTVHLCIQSLNRNASRL